MLRYEIRVDVPTDETDRSINQYLLLIIADSEKDARKVVMKYFKGKINPTSVNICGVWEVADGNSDLIHRVYVRKIEVK